MILASDGCTSRLLGLVAWFSLRVREVPGSIPGAAHVLSFSFVVRDSNVGEEAGLEREGAQEQLRGTGGGC